MTLLAVVSSGILPGQTNQDSCHIADKPSVRLKCSFKAKKRQIEFQLKNSSTPNLMLFWNGPAASNTVSMEDASGNPVSYTKFGKPINDHSCHLGKGNSAFSIRQCER